MDRHTSSSRYKTNDLVSGNRQTALGKTHCHIIDSFDNNSALGSGNMHFLLICLRNLLQDIFIRDLFLMILFIFFQQTVDNLTFLQSAMSDCCKHRIPVTEPIFPLNDLSRISVFQYIDKIYRFTAAVIADQFLSTDNIIFFKFLLNDWLILFFAWVLFTMFSQSRLGPLEFWDVRISILSPFWIL